MLLMKLSPRAVKLLNKSLSDMSYTGRFGQADGFYIQANKDWLEAKSKEEGVKALPKGILSASRTSY